MRKILQITAFAIAASVSGASAEVVTGQKMTKDKNGYLCSVELQTDENKEVLIQLSDYEDVWSISILLAGRADVYRNFFKANQLLDQEKLNRTFREVKIGSSMFTINDLFFFEIHRKNVNEKTTAIFYVKEKHNVAAALEAMGEDGISIASLLSLNNTVGATDEFRTCAFDAIGISSSQEVEFDSRSEYRMIFEKSFETWIKNLARADACMQARLDDDKVQEVIRSAADAFFPGILNIMKRNEYAYDLTSTLPLAKLSGLAKAKSSGCLMAGSLADMSRIPMDQAIDAAQD